MNSSPHLVQHPDVVLQDRPARDRAVPGRREGRAADEHTQGQDLRKGEGGGGGGDQSDGCRWRPPTRTFSFITQAKLIPGLPRGISFHVPIYTAVYVHTGATLVVWHYFLLALS